MSMTICEVFASHYRSSRSMAPVVPSHLQSFGENINSLGTTMMTKRTTYTRVREIYS